MTPPLITRYLGRVTYATFPLLSLDLAENVMGLSVNWDAGKFGDGVASCFLAVTPLLALKVSASG